MLIHMQWRKPIHTSVLFCDITIYKHRRRSGTITIRDFSVSWLFNWLYDFHNTYQNLRFGGQYNEHFFASTIKIALWRLFETETTLEQGFPKYAQRMPTDPRPDLIHTCTHNFVGPQILSYNSRTWNLSEKNTLHTNKHNTINKCQYYSLQNQIMCII